MNGAIINDDDRVVLVGEWGGDVVDDLTYSGTANIGEFEAAFEIISGHHLANPAESFYQGAEFMALIRRRSDGRLFGYPYWTSIAKYADDDDTPPNGDEHGFDDDEEPHWVWLPVEPFQITGYKLAAPEDSP